MIIGREKEEAKMNERYHSGRAEYGFCLWPVAGGKDVSRRAGV